MAATSQQIHPPSIVSASALWAGMGLFGLVLGLFLLAFQDTVFGGVTWLVEASVSGPNTLSTKSADMVRDGIQTWGWAGLVTAIVCLPIAFGSVLSAITRLLRPVLSNGEDELLPWDRHGRTFFLAFLAVLVFAVVAHWTLRTYLAVEWLESEDGLSEWWSVFAYMAGALAIGAAAWSLKNTQHSPVRYFYLTLAVGLFLGGMEEISWGQRIVGWSTPEALSEINVQNETTLHNFTFGNKVMFELFFWGSVIGLAGGFWRLTANSRGLSDRMRLLLPSAMMAPALLLIMVWRAGDIWQTANFPRLVMDHFNSGPRGDEVPESALGLCILIYAIACLRQSRFLARRASPAASTTPPNLVTAEESA